MTEKKEDKHDTLEQQYEFTLFYITGNDNFKMFYIDNFDDYLPLNTRIYINRIIAKRS